MVTSWSSYFSDEHNNYTNDCVHLKQEVYPFHKEDHLYPESRRIYPFQKEGTINFSDYTKKDT